MLRLIVGSGAAQKDVELYEFDPVEITYQFQNISEINAASSGYTQTFRVPLTEANSTIFGAVNSLGASSNFNLKSRQEARLIYGGVPLMDGYIQVKRYIQQKGRYMDVELVFFGETAALSRTLGDKMLSDLDLSMYEVVYNATNIAATWTGTGVPLRFGVVDRGQNWAGASTWGAAQTGLKVGDFTGFFAVSELVKAIFTQNGLNWYSDFIGSVGEKLYLMCNAGGLANKYDTLPTNIQFNVGLTANLNFNNTTYTQFNFTEAGAFFDSGNNVSGGAYTIPAAGSYSFQVRIKFSTIPATGVVSVDVFKNGVQWQSILSIPVGSLSVVQNYQVITPSEFLNAGDVIDVRYKNTTTATGTFKGTGNLEAPTTSFALYAVQFGGGTTTYNPGSNMPDMKQIEFLNALQKAFNLVFIPDRSEPNKYVIEPWADYVSFGNQKDWTDKLSVDKDVEIMPTTDLQKRRYWYKMRENGDFISTAVKESLGRTYGTMEIRDTGNDFATGDFELQGAFAPFIPCPIPQTDFPVMRMLQADGTPVEKPAPTIAFWNGKLALGDFYFEGSVNADFPVFSDCEKYFPTIDSIDLNFGYDPKFRSIPAHSRDALFYRFWYPLTGELYSADARIMNAHFKLDTFDISTFNWSDIIFIENVAWRILSIEFVANDPGALSKVKLLKIVPPERICRDLPYEILKTGQVTFINSSGVISTPQQQCCELFGYTYNPTNGTCWGTPPLPTPKTYPQT